ncbi:10027_t:CDS:2 [Ambispora gerdemannii]|uniref:10027_t:CDS:1 n=1 Tax=Ambispora gerdemannii TaxID=144530 RepID=A0A9N9HCE5_9GLOM|nr:10027_t:CDS:2 [Ambispora gerdemannii]
MTTQVQPSHEWLSQETFSLLLKEYLLARNEKRRAKALLTLDDIKKCIDILEKGQKAENYTPKFGYWFVVTESIKNCTCSVLRNGTPLKTRGSFFLLNRRRVFLDHQGSANS